MEEGSRFVGDLGGFWDGLDDAGLVVGPHEGNEGGFAGTEFVPEFVEIDAASGRNPEVGDFVALTAGEGSERLEDGGVFGGAGDDVFPFGKYLGSGVDRGDVGFGAAGGEDGFLRGAAEQAGDLSARGGDGFGAGA